MRLAAGFLLDAVPGPDPQADVDRLPYARAALKEILRMKAGGWVVWKQAAVDLAIDEIPEGTLVHPCSAC